MLEHDLQLCSKYVTTPVQFHSSHRWESDSHLWDEWNWTGVVTYFEHGYMLVRVSRLVSTLACWWWMDSLGKEMPVKALSELRDLRPAAPPCQRFGNFTFLQSSTLGFIVDQTFQNLPFEMYLLVLKKNLLVFIKKRFKRFNHLNLPFFGLIGLIWI